MDQQELLQDNGALMFHLLVVKVFMGIAESEMDADLDLDDPTASFELVYSGGDMGWTIIGIN